MASGRAPLRCTLGRVSEPTAPADLPFPVTAEVDLDPVWLDAFGAAEADLAAGRTTFFSSVEEFDAYAREIVADDGQHLPHSA